MEQFSMFDFIYDKFQIKNKIRLIEFFAGYGSQNLSMKFLGANYEHHRICEWATKSIQAYNDIHIQDYTDYSQCCTFDEVLNYLFKKGISMNYNEPMTYNQIKRKGEQWCRTTYNNIIATRNLVNIQQVKGGDLDITNPEDFTYLLTYSFPCQDLSLAGKGKGMEKGSGTRSGMLWEVERILKECEQGKLPQVLLMENVPQVHSQENMPHLLLWINELEKLGYKSYWQDLNAKNFGIPQNRERCFMISILGDYNYNFPKKIPLRHKLKDLLESNVDEKYYLSEQMIQGMMNTNFESYKLENKLLDLNGTANCIIARFEGTPQCIKVGNYSPSGHNASSIVSGDGIAPTVMENHGTVTAVVESQYSEYSLKKIKGNIVQDDVVGTITASAMQSFNHDNCHLVVEENRFFKQAFETLENNDCEEGDTINAYNQTVDKSGTSPTLTTRPEGFKTAILPVTKELRIRKLTPRECWRLMGVKDEDFENVSKNQSNSSLYHLAGDSIVTTCLMGLIGELLGIDYQTKIRELIEDLKQE